METEIASPDPLPSIRRKLRIDVEDGASPSEGPRDEPNGAAPDQDDGPRGMK